MIGNAGLLMIENKTRSPFVLFNAKNAIEYTTTASVRLVYTGGCLESFDERTKDILLF